MLCNTSCTVYNTMVPHMIFYFYVQSRRSLYYPWEHATHPFLYTIGQASNYICVVMVGMYLVLRVADHVCVMMVGRYLLLGGGGGATCYTGTTVLLCTMVYWYIASD